MLLRINTLNSSDITYDEFNHLLKTLKPNRSTLTWNYSPILRRCNKNMVYFRLDYKFSIMASPLKLTTSYKLQYPRRISIWLTIPMNFNFSINDC